MARFIISYIVGVCGCMVTVNKYQPEKIKSAILLVNMELIKQRSKRTCFPFIKSQDFQLQFCILVILPGRVGCLLILRDILILRFLYAWLKVRKSYCPISVWKQFIMFMPMMLLKHLLRPLKTKRIP